MPQTLTSVLIHVIFSTKNRAPDIRLPVRERLWLYIAGILRSSGANVHIVNGGLDHVHVLFTLPPTLRLADLMRLAKTTLRDGCEGSFHHIVASLGNLATQLSASVTQSSTKSSSTLLNKKDTTVSARLRKNSCPY